MHLIQPYSLLVGASADWIAALATVALLLSWSLGVMQSLLSTPLVNDAQLSDPWWSAYTLFYGVALWVGSTVTG